MASVPLVSHCRGPLQPAVYEPVGEVVSPVLPPGVSDVLGKQFGKHELVPNMGLAIEPVLFCLKGQGLGEIMTCHM